MRTKFLLLINMISDIDECDKGIHSCSFNAVCNNTEGSYDCTCKPGYEEDGDDCTGNFFFNLVILHAKESKRKHCRLYFSMTRWSLN